MFFKKIANNDLCYGVKNETLVVFDPETLFITYCSSAVGIDGLSDSDLQQIVKNYYTLAKTQSKEKIAKLDVGNDYLLARFLLTSRCNLACSYCQMKKGIGEQKWKGDISKQIIDTFLDKIYASDYEYITIHFSGGEPLLLIDKIDYISKKARGKLKNKVRLAMSTNGLLADEHIAKILALNNIKTVVSLDGYGYHNVHRKHASGKEITQKVLKGIEILKKNGVDVGLSLVVTTANIKYIDEIVGNIIAEIKPKSIGLNYVHYPGFDKETHHNFAEEDLKEYANILFRTYKQCRDNDVFEEQANRIIEPFVYIRPRKHQCSSQNSQISISPSGSICPCKTFLTRGYGSVEYSKWNQFATLRNIEEFKVWRTRTVDSIEECSRCYVRNLCGGGCGYEAYVNHGTICKPNFRYCIVPRTILNQIINELFIQNAFADKASDMKLLKQGKREVLLGKSGIDIYQLTASIGHLLETNKGTR